MNLAHLGTKLSRLRGKAAARLAKVAGLRASPANPPSNPGYCHCCRQQTRFIERHEWLRDHYACASCGSVPRQRHINHVLDTVFPGWEKLKLHESSPDSTFISRYCPGYSSSQLLEGVPYGETRGGVRCENLEQLTFGDEEFELFITLDVFEHVFHPEKALREILRVLKPGGAHVFTAPKHPSLPRSVRRAVLEGGTVKHLHEPQYHGNPVGDGRALVTWDYGQDFEGLLGQWSGAPVTTYVTRDRSLGLDGAHLEVFVVWKPAMDTSTPPA